MNCVSCGIDWADDHHDVDLVDQNGTLLAAERISDDRAGLEHLLDLLAQHGDSHEHPIPVAIETPRGLLVAALRSGRPVYAINPLAASRYRARRSVSNAKSDPADARLLAEILRTDRDAHRPLPADSDLLGGLLVLTRAHQDAIWERRRITNRLRAHLHEYFTTALRIFEGKNRPGLDSSAARRVLGAAPTPTTAAEHTWPTLRALLATRARPHRTFEQHPDAPIITSFPGLSTISGAQVLAELGDDRTRFASARSVKAYAGSAPITRASGRHRTVLARTVKNQRLASAGYMWAFAALSNTEARRHYDRRRAGGEHHTAALRNLFNKMLGSLHHCLQTTTPYDPARAFQPGSPHQPESST